MITTKTLAAGRTTGIYAIKNSVNGKVYVGSSSNSIANRWNGHKSRLRKGIHHSKHLQRAWNKFGPEAFKLHVLLVCEPDACLEYEQVFIDSLKSSNKKHGYNVQPTAGSPRGKIVSEETKRKLSASLTGRKLSPEHIANMAKGHIGIKRSAEVCKKMSEIAKQRASTPEGKANTERFAAYARSDDRRRTIEARAKNSAALKAYWSTRKAGGQ